MDALEPGEVRFAGFAIHPSAGEAIDDVADRMRAAGFDPGPVSAMSRVRPDGVELHWRLTFAGAIDDPPGVAIDGVLPFVIDWGDTPSPATTTPRMGRLVSLDVTHPDAGVRSALDALALDRVRIIDGPRSLVATVELADGRTVEIDAP